MASDGIWDDHARFEYGTEGTTSFVHEDHHCKMALWLPKWQFQWTICWSTDKPCDSGGTFCSEKPMSRALQTEDAIDALQTTEEPIRVLTFQMLTSKANGLRGRCTSIPIIYPTLDVHCPTGLVHSCASSYCWQPLAAETIIHGCAIVKFCVYRSHYIIQQMDFNMLQLFSVGIFIWTIQNDVTDVTPE